jgi:hypothetical protein
VLRYATRLAGVITLLPFIVLVGISTGLTAVAGYTVTTLILKSEHIGGGLKMQNVSQIRNQIIALALVDQIYQSTAISKAR